MDILDFLIVFSIGWFGGQWYLSYQLKKSITRIAEKYGMTFEEWEESITDIIDNSKSKVKVPKLFTEYEGNSIFLYNKDTGSFLCQGKSLEELAEIINGEYDAAVVVDRGKQLIFMKGKVTEGFNESKTSQVE